MAKKKENKMMRAADPITMDFRTAIKRKFWETLYMQKDFTLSEIADKLRVEASYLSRMAADHENLNIDISLIRDLMKLLNDYRILEAFAYDCGFDITKKPKVAVRKSDNIDVVTDLHATLNETMNAVNKYMDGEPTRETYKRAIGTLDNATRKTIYTKKYIEKNVPGQLEFNL